jgi:hypothetical protein
MTDAAHVVEQLITTEGIHAFVFICEAADKYLPIIDSLEVLLANGKSVKVVQIEVDVAKKVEEAKKTLKREDRIVWALRFYKKALIEELLWLAHTEPQFFQRKFGAPPAPDQSGLERQLRKLADVDITPFQEADPADPEALEPPYTGYSTIDTINQRLGHYMEIAETYGENEPDNIIHKLIFQRQPFGEIVSLFRRGEIALLKKHAAGLTIVPAHGPNYDMQDDEGPIKTLVNFPNGWKWLNLMRNCSEIRNDPQAPPSTAITGHCANTAAKGNVTVLELVEPLGDNRWKHHAMFVLSKDGQLGEMKGRKNQKPSPRLHKYILELLRQRKEIKGMGYHSSDHHLPSNDFRLGDFPKPYLDILKRERPDLISDNTK